MHRRSFAIAAIALLVVACGTTTPSREPANAAPSEPTAPSASSPATANDSPSAATASGATELRPGLRELKPGRYGRVGFQPQITFEIDEGWFVGSLANDFFDIQQDKGSPDVVAVQFARVDDILGANSAIVTAATADAAAEALRANPGLVVIDDDVSRISGLEVTTVTVENQGTATCGILDVSLGRLSIDPGRRLRVSFLDAADGVLAVMVGGSVAEWEHAVTIAEPVVDSVVIGGG
jgi:hypothetical protein